MQAMKHIAPLGHLIVRLMTHGDGCRREERPSHAGGRLGITDDVPTLGSIHHAVVVNVRPFGLFVELPGFRRNGLVHNSQISEDVVFSREDEDDAKVAAMEYFAPKGSQVMPRLHTGDIAAPKPKRTCEGLCAKRGISRRFGSRSQRSGMTAGALPRSTVA